MGIQDRDYVREHAPRAESFWEERTRNPFAPPREGPSSFVVTLTWVAVAFVLYLGYQWLESRHSGQRALATGDARSMPPNKAPAPQVSTYSHFPAPVRPRRAEDEQRETPPARTGGTIYRCRAYNGGTFWAQTHCGQHQALIESIVPVPAGMPFEQQVELAQHRRHSTATNVYNTHIEVSQEPGASPKRECKALDARVEQLDAMARQPQSGQMQDWIRGQRQSARDRQFALRC